MYANLPKLLLSILALFVAFDRNDKYLSCLSSPTITARLARYKRGKHVAISHCEASSMITTSNKPAIGGIDEETSTAVVHQQGRT